MSPPQSSGITSCWYRLDRLRHDAVVRGDDEDDDIGHLSPSGTHRRESGVAGRVEERNATLFDVYDVGADMLRDSAGLALGNVAAADVVKQRCLAVVDMAHDRYHRRALNGFGLRLARLDDDVLDLLLLEELGLVPHLLDDELGGILVDDLIDRGHHAEIHQGLDDLARLDRHFLRQFRDRDRLGDVHVAHDRRRRPLESMLRLYRDADVATRRSPLPATPTLAAGDVEFLASVTCLCGLFLLPPLTFALLLASGLGTLARLRRTPRLLLLLPCGLRLGQQARFLGGLAAGFFLGLALLLELLGLRPRFLFGPALVFLFLDAPLLGELGLFLGAPDLVQLFLLLLGLLLQHVPLDVGALAPDFDIDGARPALPRRLAQLTLGLALQRDLPRRRGLRLAAVAAPQER